MSEDVDDRPKVYLAGPIQHADDGGHGWRDKVIDDYRTCQYLNPLDFFDGGEDKATILPEEEAEDYEAENGEFVITDEELVEKDKRMVHEADGLIIGFPEKVPSWGTPQEQSESWTHPTNPAEAEPKKPIVVWHGHIPAEELSPWIRYHATFYSRSLTECMEYLEVALDAVGVCINCRVESGLGVDDVHFSVEDSTCVRCNEYRAMRPKDND